MHIHILSNALHGTYDLHLLDVCEFLELSDAQRTIITVPIDFDVSHCDSTTSIRLHRSLTFR